MDDIELLDGAGDEFDLDAVQHGPADAGLLRFGTHELSA
jgi:hypothetical protein